MRSLLALFIAVFLSSVAVAQEQVNAKEIRALLSGNSIIGSWFGEEYKQYFAENGATIYSPKNAQSSPGEWRVNEAENTYESIWLRGQWTGYRIVRDDGNYFWLDHRNVPQPFSVVKGRQIIWNLEE